MWLWKDEGEDTDHDVIVLVARRAPSILVAVWAVEYPPVLPEESERERRKTEDTRVPATLVHTLT